MKYLLDTNIFLEILLSQEKKERCKEFIFTNLKEIVVSDFSLHSIGVLLFRFNKPELFGIFITDIFSSIDLITLPKPYYTEIELISQKYHLDFDDSYQTAIAQKYNLSLVTLDHDFLTIRKDVQVIFL